jgi:hypothetical protein
MRLRIKAKDLQAGDRIRYCYSIREIAEVLDTKVKSQFYPYRPYRAIRVRWAGQTDWGRNFGPGQYMVVERGER